MTAIDTRCMARCIELKAGVLTLRRVVRVPSKRGDFAHFTAYYAEEFTRHTDGAFTEFAPVATRRYTRLQHAIASCELYSGQDDTVLLTAIDHVDIVSDTTGYPGHCLPVGTVVRNPKTPSLSPKHVYIRLPTSPITAFVYCELWNPPHVAVDNIPIVHNRKAI